MKVFKIQVNRKLMMLLVSVFGTGMVATAQLKVGDNPTSIQKSSILELESTRQGLLLPRLSDTAAINALTPPDGMIIYLTADNSLRIRSNGSWKKLASMADAIANWSLTGNSGTDSATNFIGTIDGQPLTIKTANNARMIIGSNGNGTSGAKQPLYFLIKVTNVTGIHGERTCISVYTGNAGVTDNTSRIVIIYTGTST